MLIPGLFFALLHLTETSPPHSWQHALGQRRMDFEASTPMHFKQDRTHFASMPRGGKHRVKKKRFSLHLDTVHSDHLFFCAQNLWLGSAAASLLNINTKPFQEQRVSFFTSRGAQTLPRPRAGSCFMYRSVQALRRFRCHRLCSSLTDCEESCDGILQRATIKACSVCHRAFLPEKLWWSMFHLIKMIPPICCGPKREKCQELKKGGVAITGGLHDHSKLQACIYTTSLGTSSSDRLPTMWLIK